LIEAVSPDIVVLGLASTRLGGVEAVAELKRRQPNVEILVLTRYHSEDLCSQVIDAGASGFVCKTESEHLGPALEAVSRGETYRSPTMADGVSRHSRDEVWDRQCLTHRERQIVRLVAYGFSNKAISRELDISVKTTETHRASAMRKAGTRTAAALTIYAARNGIVDL